MYPGAIVLDSIAKAMRLSGVEVSGLAARVNSYERR